MADLVKMILEELREEDIPIIAAVLNEQRATVKKYRIAVQIFKEIHISTPPSYRKKVLEEEKGEIRFKRGPGK